jgi:hypothetical protein
VREASGVEDVERQCFRRCRGGRAEPPCQCGGVASARCVVTV